MQIVVRPIRRDEPATVLAVIDALVPDRRPPEPDAPEDSAVFLDDPNSFMVAAFDDDRPIGMAWGAHIRFPNGRRMTYLHHLEVAEACRNAGLGTALMDATFELAEAAGSAKLWLSTGMHNTGAQRLYERLGGDRKELGDVNFWWDVPRLSR